MYSLKHRLVLLAVAVLLAGCGSAGMFGATPGGTQDMQFARDLVEAGHVPPAEAFIVEGMFSEHDLPVDGVSCQDLLCLGTAVAVAPNRVGEPAAWVQIGLSSTIDPEEFQRGSIAAVFVIDESGSMGYEYEQATAPGQIAKHLAHSLVDQMTDDDHVAIVTFGSAAHKRMGWRKATAQRVRNEINDLKSRGSTNMEAGMRKGFELAKNAPAADSVRIFLITDAQPNVGATEKDSFRDIIVRASENQEIGTTVFGAGLGLGVELMDFMSEVRGGNAFTLSDTERVDDLMENDWPWLMSPIAYDMELEARTNEHVTVGAAYGFPGAEPDVVASEVATVFLSKNRGALLLELAGEPDGAGIHLELSYEGLDGEAHHDLLQARYEETALTPLDEDGEYWSQDGVHKTVSLALLVTAMKEAATLYGTDRDAAIAELDAGLARFIDEAVEIDDPAIDAEAEFWPLLLELMEEGAPQGSYYPGQY